MTGSPVSCSRRRPGDDRRHRSVPNALGGCAADGRLPDRPVGRGRPARRAADRHSSRSCPSASPVSRSRPADCEVSAMSSAKRLPRWPLLLIAAPAAVAVWSGWVGLGGLCGFGIIHPLPGIVPWLRLDTAITLPVGVEAYGAYALGAWLNPATTGAARTFARRSALGALLLGMTGQVAYHLLAATGA